MLTVVPTTGYGEVTLKILKGHSDDESFKQSFEAIDNESGNKDATIILHLSFCLHKTNEKEDLGVGR